MYFLSIDKSRNRFRWYGVSLQANLFGGYDVLRSWGRIGHRGTTLRRHFAGLDEAERELVRIAHVRFRHGYKPAKDARRHLLEQKRSEKMTA